MDYKNGLTIRNSSHILYFNVPTGILAFPPLMVPQWPCSPPPLLLPLKSPSPRPGSVGGANILSRIHRYISKVCFYQVSCLPHSCSLPQTLNTAGYSSTNPGMQWDLESTPMHLCSPTVHLDCMRSREGSMNGGDMKLGTDMLWVCTNGFWVEYWLPLHCLAWGGVIWRGGGGEEEHMVISPHPGQILL